MFRIRGTLEDGSVVNMKSDKPTIYEAGQEFFETMFKKIGEPANRMPRVVFTFKDSAQDSFSVKPKTAETDAKPTKPKSKK